MLCAQGSEPASAAGDLVLGMRAEGEGNESLAPRGPWVRACHQPPVITQTARGHGCHANSVPSYQLATYPETWEVEGREHPSFHTHPSQAAGLPGLHPTSLLWLSRLAFQGSTPHTSYPFLSGLEGPGVVPPNSGSEVYKGSQFRLLITFEGSQPSWDLLLPTPKPLFLGPVGLLTLTSSLGAAQPPCPNLL